MGLVRGVGMVICMIQASQVQKPLLYAFLPNVSCTSSAVLALFVPLVSGARWESSFIFSVWSLARECVADGIPTRVLWPLFRVCIDLPHPSINNGVLWVCEGVMFVSMQSLMAHTQQINNVCGIDELMDGKLCIMAARASSSYGNWEFSCFDPYTWSCPPA